MTGACPGSALAAFWLIPARPWHEAFSEIIGELADEFDAPGFEPHLTLFSGRRESADAAVARARQGCTTTGVIELAAAGVSTTAEFFMTMFVEFASTTQLEALRRFLRQGSKVPFPAGRAYRSHLSLLYQTLPEATRAGLEKRFSFRGERIAFDRIAVVRPAGGGDDWTDVAGWETLFRGDLRPGSGPDPRR